MGRRPPPPPPMSTSPHRRQPLPTAHGHGNGSSALKWLALGALACVCLLMLLIMVAVALYLLTRDQEAPAKSPPSASAIEVDDERQVADDESRGSERSAADGTKGESKSESKPSDSSADASESADGAADGEQPGPPAPAANVAPAPPMPSGEAGAGGGQPNGDQREGGVEPSDNEPGAKGSGEGPASDDAGASDDRVDAASEENAGQSTDDDSKRSSRNGGPRALGEGQPVPEPEVVKPATGELFGLRAKGKRFVYLIDCSSNMSTERLERIRDELVAALEQLDDDQRFFIFLYSDDAFPMYHPEIAVTPTYAAANASEMAKVKAWLSDYYAWGDANPAQAVARALKMKPDAVFLLTASKFDDSAVDRVTEVNERKTPIHAIAIFEKEAATDVKAIARRNGGHSKFVRE